MTHKAILHRLRLRLFALADELGSMCPASLILGVRLQHWARDALRNRKAAAADAHPCRALCSPS